MRVYVETGAGLHRHGAAGAWTFDLPYWGLAGLGNDEASALVALRRLLARARFVLQRAG